MRYIMLFEGLTRATVRDCVIDETFNRIIFLVKPEDMGLAIGRRGEKVNYISKLLGKKIDVIQTADTPEELIRASLMPAKVKAVKIITNPLGEKVAYVTVEASDKSIAIGPRGRNVHRAKLLAKRYFDIDKVIIT